jgi:hypothetical protein
MSLNVAKNSKKANLIQNKIEVAQGKKYDPKPEKTPNRRYDYLFCWTMSG